MMVIWEYHFFVDIKTDFEELPSLNYKMNTRLDNLMECFIVNNSIYPFQITPLKF